MVHLLRKMSRRNSLCRYGRVVHPEVGRNHKILIYCRFVKERILIWTRGVPKSRLVGPCRAPFFALLLFHVTESGTQKGQNGAVFRFVLALDGKRLCPKIDAVPCCFSGERHGKLPFFSRAVFVPCSTKRKTTRRHARKMARGSGHHETGRRGANPPSLPEWPQFFLNSGLGTGKSSEI